MQMTTIARIKSCHNGRQRRLGKLGGRQAGRQAGCPVAFLQVPTTDVRPNVVDNDQRAGQEEPHEPVKDVAHKEAGGYEDNQQDHVSPGILPKLVCVAPLLQLEHKCDEACRHRQVAGVSLVQLRRLVRHELLPQPGCYRDRADWEGSIEL